MIPLEKPTLDEDAIGSPITEPQIPAQQEQYTKQSTSGVGFIDLQSENLNAQEEQSSEIEQPAEFDEEKNNVPNLEEELDADKVDIDVKQDIYITLLEHAYPENKFQAPSHCWDEIVQDLRNITILSDDEDPEYFVEDPEMIPFQKNLPLNCGFEYPFSKWPPEKEEIPCWNSEQDDSTPQEEEEELQDSDEEDTSADIPRPKSLSDVVGMLKDIVNMFHNFIAFDTDYESILLNIRAIVNTGESFSPLIKEGWSMLERLNETCLAGLVQFTTMVDTLEKMGKNQEWLDHCNRIFDTRKATLYD